MSFETFLFVAIGGLLLGEIALLHLLNRVIKLLEVENEDVR